MAGRGITINILTNVRNALKGVGDVEKALSDVESTLEDMGRDGTRSTDRMSRGFRDLAGDTRKGAQETDRFEKELRDVQLQAGETEDALTGVGETTKKTSGITRAMGTDIRQAGDALGDIIEGRFAGAAHSLLGATTSLSQAIPVLGIGIAGALALGLPLLNSITGEIQQQEKDAEALRDRLSEAYSEAAKAGRDYIDTAQLIAEAHDLMFNTDRAEEWKRVQEDAKLIGMDVTEVIEANFGVQEKQEQVLTRLNHLLADQGGLIDENGRYTSSFGQIIDGVLPNALSRWENLNEVTKESASNAGTAQRVISDMLKQAIRDAGEATEEIDEFGNALYTLPDGQKIVIDAETKQAHTNLDKFKGDLDEVADSVTTATLKFTADTREVDEARRRLQQQISVGVSAIVRPNQVVWQ